MKFKLANLCLSNLFYEISSSIFFSRVMISSKPRENMNMKDAIQFGVCTSEEVLDGTSTSFKELGVVNPSVL